MGKKVVTIRKHDRSKPSSPPHEGPGNKPGPKPVPVRRHKRSKPSYLRRGRMARRGATVW